MEEKQNEVVVQNAKSVEVAEEKNVDYKQLAINYLKAQGTNLSDGHLTQFVELAKCYHLNPFKREIYAVVYNSKDGQRLNIIVGYETYLKRAEATGLLDGWSCEFDGKKATCTIWRKNWSRPFVHSVEMAEYDGSKEGSVKGLWKTKPVTMIKKVAVAQAMRLCFPNDLGGMPYTSEEMSSVGDFEIAEKVNLKTATNIAPPRQENKITPNVADTRNDGVIEIQNSEDDSELLGETPFDKTNKGLKPLAGEGGLSLAGIGELSLAGEDEKTDAMPSADAKSENTSRKKTRKTNLVYPFDNVTECYLNRLFDSVKYKVETESWRISFNKYFMKARRKIDSQEKLDVFADWAEDEVEKQIERENWLKKMGKKTN